MRSESEDGGPPVTDRGRSRPPSASVRSAQPRAAPPRSAALRDGGVEPAGTVSGSRPAGGPGSGPSPPCRQGGRETVTNGWNMDLRSHGLVSARDLLAFKVLFESLDSRAGDWREFELKLHGRAGRLGTVRARNRPSANTCF